MFYTLQPEVVSIPNPTAEFRVIDETLEKARAKEPPNQEMFDSICEAVEKARSESKSPDKQGSSMRASNRLLVPQPQSVADPIILQNQKNANREEEFSFRETQISAIAPYSQQQEEDERNVNEQSFLLMERPRGTESVPKPLAPEAHP